MKGRGILLGFIIVNTGLIHRNKLETYKLYFFFFHSDKEDNLQKKGGKSNYFCEHKL